MLTRFLATGAARKGTAENEKIDPQAVAVVQNDHREVHAEYYAAVALEMK